METRGTGGTVAQNTKKSQFVFCAKKHHKNYNPLSSNKKQFLFFSNNFINL
jgi:hypothetical protein